MENNFMKTENSLMKTLLSMQALMIAFISIINLTAGIIGGVWLLFTGLFFEVLAGFLYSIFGSYILGFVMLIGFIFAGPGMYFYKKRQYTLSFIFAFLNQILDVIIIFISVMYVFGVAVQLSGFANFVPVILFAYAISFAPWAFLAGEDEKVGNKNAKIMIISGQTGFVIGIILMLITGQGILLSLSFLIGLIGGSILNMIPIIEDFKRQKRLNAVEHNKK